MLACQTFGPLTPHLGLVLLYSKFLAGRDPGDSPFAHRMYLHYDSPYSGALGRPYHALFINCMRFAWSICFLFVTLADICATRIPTGRIRWDPKTTLMTSMPGCRPTANEMSNAGRSM